jgi:hypothetical protein
MVERIYNGGEFVKDNIENEVNKKWMKVVENSKLLTNSFKLISFDYLCKWLLAQDNLDKIDKKKYITNITEKKDTPVITESKLVYDSVKNIPDNSIEFRSIENICM